MDHGQKEHCHCGVLLIILLILVEILPSGSLNHSKTVEHKAEVSKEGLGVFLVSSVAWWEAASSKELVRLASVSYNSEELRTELASCSSALALSQYGFLVAAAAAHCCSLFLLLKSPEEFIKVHAAHQAYTKRTKSAAAWT